MDLEGGAAAALRALARTVAASPFWQTAPAAALAIRLEPRPRLALVGSFEDSDLALLEQQKISLRHGCRTLRYVSYGQAEEDCRLLADLLLEHFSGDLTGVRFTAIPHGGLIVLGMLAKILDLDHDQLRLSLGTDAPTVVVDDCALSGERFAGWLDGRREGRVVFAQLYSEPALRWAVEADERVEACYGARDLQAEDLQGQELQAQDPPTAEADARLRDLWQGRLGGARYRVTRLNHLCFPWTEPRRTLWDASRNRAEAAWNVVPDDYCLRPWRPSSAPLPIYEVPPAAGPLRPTEGVLFAPFSGGLALADFESGESYFLQDSAKEMWESVLATGHLTQALEILRGTYEDPPESLAEDLDGFVRDLLARKILQELPLPSS